MIRMKHVLGAGALLLASVAAHAVDTSYTFDSITVIQHSPGAADLTGILTGDTTPTSITVPQNESSLSIRCANYYDLMLQNPGPYLLSITLRTTTPGFPPGSSPVTNLFSCSLQLKP